MVAKVRPTQEYLPTHRNSMRLYERAVRVFPSGVTHESRYMKPFPFYVLRANGAHKWDVDGNEYIDYRMAHGALLLGHGHPAVVLAVQGQMEKGTHWSACHELEVEWAELVQSLVPSAEKVRFVASGTEAGIMALRLARAFTGKTRILKFQGHFQGWSDHLVPGSAPPFNIPNSPGLLQGDLEQTIVIPNDITALQETLARDDEVAAVIMEAAGARSGKIPFPPHFLRAVREITAQRGVLLILDEVVTGFRWSSGGVQAKVGVTPDITMLGKILAGGLPGGAVVGRADVFEALEFKDDPQWDRFKRISHPGTYNANPLSAAAGVASLKVVATSEPHQRANALAATLRDSMNQTARRMKMSCVIYGESSVYHIYFGAYSLDRVPAEHLMAAPWSLSNLFQEQMLMRGVHTHLSGFLSAAHTDEDVARTVEAFEATLEAMRRNGTLAQGPR